MIDTDEYEGEDWLVRYYNHDDKHGDGMDFDTLEEAIEVFNEGVEVHPDYEWTLYHYHNYKPDGEGGYHEPIEDTIMHWCGEEMIVYMNMLSMGGDEE